jgi:hypothetical protein
VIRSVREIHLLQVGMKLHLINSRDDRSFLQQCIEPVTS